MNKDMRANVKCDIMTLTISNFQQISYFVSSRWLVSATFEFTQKR